MKNLERIKNILKETMLVQVVMSLIYVLVYLLDCVPIVLILFSLVAIIPVSMTSYYMKSDKEESQKIKRFIFTCIIWIIENTIILSCICEIAPGWWPLTYMILIGYIAIAPIVLVLIGKVISFIYHKIKM